MVIEEALKLMRAEVDAAKEKFEQFPFKLSLREEYADSKYNEVESVDKATYAFIGLDIRYENSVSDDEYTLSIAAVIQKGKVSEADLKLNIKEFRKLVLETQQKFIDSSNLKSTLHTLCEKADSDIDESMKKILRLEKVMKFTKIAGVIILIVIIAMMIIGPFIAES